MTELVTIPSDISTLPDSATLRSRLEAIRRFQQDCQSLLIQGHDYGTIPGTPKPTLFKPGAEKITKILALADNYEVMSETEDWERGFFAYKIRCVLADMITGRTFATGIGECNSMEAKYRWRWVFQSELRELGYSKNPERTRTIKTRMGDALQYRIENEDIYTQVNTILKMAKKRALVDAALSAGRLSDIFTQDIEDLPIAAGREEMDGMTPGNSGQAAQEPDPSMMCPEHGVKWFKKGKMRGYAHPLGEGEPWCNQEDAREVPTVSNELPPADPDTGEILTPPESQVPPPRDPASIRNMEDCYAACQEDFGKGKAAVLRIAGYSRQEDISNPGQVYMQVAATMETQEAP